jgi:hypothetical protein
VEAQIGDVVNIRTRSFFVHARNYSAGGVIIFTHLRAGAITKKIIFIWIQTIVSRRYVVVEINI